MELLGEDGRGYELARKLESRGVWRSWLGDALYSTFSNFLSSPAAWDAFMRIPADSNTSNAQSHLQLQLRARALLYDKASISLFTQALIPSAHISKLNPNYLDLHGDDVYFTLESCSQDGDQHRLALGTSNATSTKGQSRISSSTGSRFSEVDDALHQRLKQNELPETWYTQFFEKYRATKSYRLMFSDRESEKRTPEQMSNYLRVLDNHKRRRVAFSDDSLNMRSNSVTGDNNVDTLFFPETMFTHNCVPEGAGLLTSGPESTQKLQCNGVLDNLPQILAKSSMINPIMIERLGIKPEYLNPEHGHQARGNGSQGNKKLLSQEQASQMSQKVVARLLNNVGFESSSDTPLDVLAQLLVGHFSKLGSTLRLLADSYRKQYSATELVKMFLQTAGYSNIGPLTEFVKDKSKTVVQQTQQVVGNQLLVNQTQLQAQQHPPTQQSQQMLRQLSPQILNQMSNPHFLAYQQQHLARIRRAQQQQQHQQQQQQQHQQQQQQQQQQQPTPRPVMNASMDKDGGMVQVKMENSSDTNVFSTMNPRQAHYQQQLRQQQQLAAMSSLHAQQANNQYRQMSSPLQIPQSPNMSMSRAPPVKVEGFQELMGGDSSTKSEGK